MARSGKATISIPNKCRWERVVDKEKDRVRQYMKRTIKKEIFQDNFIKRWTCGAKNHPQGWSWWKRHNRKLLRHKLKGDIDYE